MKGVGRTAGKTHMMLLEALAAADGGKKVYVVVQNQDHAAYCREILGRITGTRHPKGIVFITPSYPHIYTVGGKPIIQGAPDVQVFVDHYVGEMGSMKEGT